MPKDNGWVKIHRKILGTDLTASQFKFFIGAILLAKSPKAKDSGVVILSVRQLATELRMSRSEVWRREKELEAMGMLTLLDKGFSINNYDYYQTGKSVPPTGQTEGHQSKDNVSPTGQSVSLEGQTVSPTGQSVPSHEAKSAHKKNKNNKKYKNIILPEWIDKDAWEGFLEVRKSKKAASTQYALSLIIKDLEKFKISGEDPNEILKRSIMNSWKGVFSLKGGQSGAYKQDPRQLTPRNNYTKVEDL